MQIRSTHIRRGLRTAAAAALVLAFAVAAEAGPPLICHQFDAGRASLLPWGTSGKDWNAPDRSYDVGKLTADVLKLLSADAPVLARMENMRRATIYASQDERIAAELLTAIMARAQADAGKGHDPLAWFDAGYLVETYRQASHVYKWDMLAPAERSAWKHRSEPAGVDGYAMVKKALQLSATPEMEFAASLMKDGPASAEHRRRAASGAPTGSLLARNLASY